LHLDRAHAEVFGALEIQCAVIDETALVRIDLRDLNR